MLFGFDETWVAKMAEKHIAIGDTVYDIGAHIGYTSLLFAKLVQPTGKVHAFELLPSVANNYLAKTVAANSLEDTIAIHPIGLANGHEEIEIYVGKTMMGNLDRIGYETKELERCIIETLDQYLVDSLIAPPNLMKVDIERAEVNFLKGATATIKKFQPILIIEFHNVDLLRTGYEILTGLNYEMTAENGVVNKAFIEAKHSFYGNVIATPKGKRI